LIEFGAVSSVTVKIFLPVVLSLFLLVLCLWLLFGRGPRRKRAFRRAQRLLAQGNWKEALDILTMLNAEGGLSPAWQDRLRVAAGQCHQRAADHLLKEKQFEEALRHALEAGARLGLDVAQQRNCIVEAMLAEARRLFAGGTDDKDTQAVLNLLDRLFAVQTPCAEASFWLGLCRIRQGQMEEAMTALTAAHEQAGKQYLDTGFYLGLLLYRQGKAQESLRYLAEANRIDAGCPFVTCQMGISLVAAGGDSGLALRALQRALGPKGLGLWMGRPERAWMEAFPEGKSYVRKLAAKHTYVCPVLGPDLTLITRQGQFALAQAHYRHGDFAEAADLFAKLLQDSPPTVPLLRGLGLALARCERYDQAYKHLRIALEQEEPKDPFTAGYLALCGALGKPIHPEDKPRNVAWALRLLARYPVMGNAEWAGLLSAVHAEARRLNMDIGVDEQLLLCDTLASVNATDPQAAAAYAHLAATYPHALRPKHAFLYVRAAALHGCTSPRDLDLFARTFSEAGTARAFFAEQQWDFDDVEYLYLERSAARHPGQFPSVLGADYPARGESFLIERSHREEAAGRNDSARACVEVLLRLDPTNIPGHDRLACLHYRRGDLEGAVALLTGWHRLRPDDPWPLVRQAIIEQQRGNAARREEAIERALGLAHGPVRAAIALLGAKLALRQFFGRTATIRERLCEPLPNGRSPEPVPLVQAQALLETCLREDPQHTEALWCLAAVRSMRGDRDGLARQAPEMDRPSTPDARFHYLGAVCHLAAKNYDAVLERSQRAAEADQQDAGSPGDLVLESQFVKAWAYLHQENFSAAQQALQKVAIVEKSPSAMHARALLGCLYLRCGAYEEAIHWWSRVDPQWRSQWQLEEPLQQTVLLSGLTAYEEGRFEQAAERFREAGKLGLRDHRLGSLLVLALVRAGQRLLYSPSV
jgi:tetratricopeptide (TPR) repeat protein